MKVCQGYNLPNRNLSGLIEALQQVMADHGDMPVVLGIGCYFGVDSPYLRLADMWPRPIEVIGIDDPIGSRLDEEAADADR
jgi:hypothetical protein